MPRAARPLAASTWFGLIVGSVCCAASPPTPETAPPMPPVVEIAAPAVASPGAPDAAPSLAADERLAVRCGVDDRPKSVVGAGVPEKTIARESGLGILLKPRFVPSPFERPPSSGARAPVTRSPLIVPLAKPLAQVSVQRAKRTGSPLSPEMERALTVLRYDIAACLGAKPIPTADLRVRVHLASSGVPVAAALLESPLEDDVSRCVVETSCQVVVPKEEATGDLELALALSPVAPVYKGAVKTRATLDRNAPLAANAKQRAALERIADIVKPLAKSCAEKSPPASSFFLPLRLTVYANRLGSQTPAMGGAVIDIASCFVPKIGEAVGPMDPSLRKEKYIQVDVTFQGHEG